MLDALRPFIAAILTLPLRWLAAWLAVHGIEGLTDKTINDAVAAIIIWGLPVVSTLGVIFRRLIDKMPWANPGNTASSHLAVDDAARATALKTGPTQGFRTNDPRHFRS